MYEELKVNEFEHGTDRTIYHTNRNLQQAYGPEANFHYRADSAEEILGDPNKLRRMILDHHQVQCPRLASLDNYMKARNDGIYNDEFRRTEEGKADHRAAHNFAKIINIFDVGYNTGIPIKKASDNERINELVREYWKRREQEQLKHNITEEVDYRKHIGAIYGYMMDQIQKEINGFYARYAKKEGITLTEAKKRVSRLDMEEYERKAAKYVKDKDFSAEANEEMRLYNATMKINRLELLKANIGLELVEGFHDLQKYFDKVLTQRTLDEFQRQAGILGDTVLDNEKAAHTIVNASFHNAKFSDRIWMYQDIMKAELSKLLQVGMIQGKHPRELARHLVKLFGVRRSDAERLLQTELARVQTEAQKQSYERNGYEEYEFIALGSACKICKEIDGKHYRVKDMQPGKNAPPMHPRCRCSTAAYMDRDKFEKWLSEKEDIENHSKNDTIEKTEDKGIVEVHTVGKIDKNIYKCITEDIVTDEVIITDERIRHIQERHPNDYERYYRYLKEILEHPQYIIESNKPYTALILKEFSDEKEQFKTVLRITTSHDNPDFKNSIITFMKINDKEWKRMLKNKRILYKKE